MKVIYTSSSLHKVLSKIGSILQDIIQLCILLKQKMYGLANEKTFVSFLNNASFLFYSLF